MKKIFLFLILSFSGIFFYGQNEYHKKIQAERDSINLEFGDPEKSILQEKDITNFHGLPYYPIDKKYRVPCKFTRIEDGKEFEMKTTTNRLPVYKPYGILSFELDGKKLQLTVYQSIELSKSEEYKNYLFIPFTDNTSGEESYGGGRYLDTTIDKVESDKFYLDFNQCYNPYCAYNHRYSCPIPPSGNYIDVAIRAGAKKWHD